MKRSVIGIDVAKRVYQVAVSEVPGEVIEDRRMSRPKLLEWLGNRVSSIVVMEACGSTHWLGRRFEEFGHQVVLLPANRVKPFVVGDKTDRSDAEGILDAYRSKKIRLRAVPIKTADQQGTVSLHRLRRGWIKTRTKRFNQLRGCLREFGINLAVGSSRVIPGVHDHLDSLPLHLRAFVEMACEEVASLTERIRAVDKALRALCRELPGGKNLLSAPGIGPINATALISEVGDPHRFPSGRHFSSFLGLVAKETSSGERRHLGSITKRGNRYLRTQLIHGARSVLFAAARSDQPTSLQAWALQVQARRGHNTAVVALANRLARIVWTVWTEDRRWLPERAQA